MKRKEFKELLLRVLDNSVDNMNYNEKMNWSCVKI